jgi:azurin
MHKLLLIITLTVLLISSCNNSNKKAENNLNVISETPKENEIKIILNSNDQMKFDQNMILVKDGQKITLTLNHTGRFNKSVMGHNFVLLKKAVDVIEFAEKAMLARNNEYIPDGDQIIAYTKLIGGGESDTITFQAPEKGFYTFICTFPGHYGIMKGKLIVK